MNLLGEIFCHFVMDYHEYTVMPRLTSEPQACNVMEVLTVCLDPVRGQVWRNRLKLNPRKTADYLTKKHLTI